MSRPKFEPRTSRIEGGNVAASAIRLAVIAVPDSALIPES
jgi:hypothetical protein